MRRILDMRVIAFARFIALTAPAALTHGNCGCSNLQGTFGFTLTGSRQTGTNPGPRAAVGQLTTDGSGNLAGSETGAITALLSRRERNGNLCNQPGLFRNGHPHLRGERGRYDTTTFSVQILITRKSSLLS
jgi:hypothetical protein